MRTAQALFRKIEYYFRRRSPCAGLSARDGAVVLRAGALGFPELPGVGRGETVGDLGLLRLDLPDRMRFTNTARVS